MLKVIDSAGTEEVQRRFYDDIYSSEDNHWNTEQKLAFDQFFLKIISGNHSFNMKSFLEVGSGDGRFLLAAEETFGGVFESITAVDYSRNGTKLASTRARESKIEFVCAEYVEWSSDNSKRFDVIFSDGVFEHFEDIERALAQTKGLLSAGGLFLMSVPNALGYDINKDDQTEGFRRLKGGSRQVEWHLRIDSWKSLLIGAGFETTFIPGPDERIGFNWVNR